MVTVGIFTLHTAVWLM